MSIWKLGDNSVAVIVLHPLIVRFTMKRAQQHWKESAALSKHQDLSWVCQRATSSFLSHVVSLLRTTAVHNKPNKLTAFYQQKQYNKLSSQQRHTIGQNLKIQKSLLPKFSYKMNVMHQHTNNSFSISVVLTNDMFTCTHLQHVLPKNTAPYVICTAACYNRGCI